MEHISKEYLHSNFCYHIFSVISHQYHLEGQVCTKLWFIYKMVIYNMKFLLRTESLNSNTKFMTNLTVQMVLMWNYTENMIAKIWKQTFFWNMFNLWDQVPQRLKNLAAYTVPDKSYRFWADLLHKWSFLGYDWHPWVYPKWHAYLLY